MINKVFAAGFRNTIVNEQSTENLWIVFINDSLGELDWLSPLLVCAVETKIVNQVLIEYSLPMVSNDDLVTVHTKYFGSSEKIKFNLTCAKHLARNYDGVYAFFRRFTKRRLWDLRFFHTANQIGRRFVKSILSRLITYPNANYIFTDYNLEESICCEIYRDKYGAGTTVVYPHSTALMIQKVGTKRERPKHYKCKYFLENSSLNDYFTERFSNKISVVGSPSIQRFSQYGSQFNGNGSALFITRPPDIKNFGLSATLMKDIYRRTSNTLASKGIKLYVKHHPRQHNLSMWHDSVNEAELVDVTLNDFSHDLRFVLSFYSSAPVLFASNAIPCFDMGGVVKPKFELPYHYFDKQNRLTHALVETGIMYHWEDFGLADILSLSPENLKLMGLKCQSASRNTFPPESIQNILNILRHT